ncbi:MAG: hypothetical protein ABSA76_08760, partial [Bacteroidales bacterium]
MSGKPLILILLILLSGCSVIKTSKINTENNSAKSTDNTRIKELNLSNNNFFIKKIDIEIKINGEKQKFMAYVKYKTTGQWLLSLRSNTGVEAIRAWVTADTLLINDRLQQKLYY